MVKFKFKFETLVLQGLILKYKITNYLNFFKSTTTMFKKFRYMKKKSFPKKVFNAKNFRTNSP